jgi:hypothetical protein
MDARSSRRHADAPRAHPDAPHKRPPWSFAPVVGSQRARSPQSLGAPAAIPPTFVEPIAFFTLPLLA